MLGQEQVHSGNYNKIIESQKKIKEYVKQPVTFSKPIVSREEIGVIYPNTINAVQGKSGVHKSRLIEILCSLILSKDTAKDFLGFTANFLKKYTVLYVDTERNQKDQFPFALQKIIINSGHKIDNEVPDFDFISLIEISRDQRFESLKEYLSKLRQDSNDHLIIILDVITDCIANFNDPGESLKLIDHLNLMINQYNTTFICVIHENPGSADKARGHLGTEIMNKASTVMQIGFEKDKHNKENELIKVSYLKCRSTKKPDPFHIVYSETTGGLVLAESDMINDHLLNNTKKVEDRILKQKLGEELHRMLDKTKLIERLQNFFACSEKTLEVGIKRIIDNNAILKNHQGQNCYLKKETTHRKAYYKLVPINEIPLKPTSEI